MTTETIDAVGGKVRDASAPKKRPTERTKRWLAVALGAVALVMLVGVIYGRDGRELIAGKSAPENVASGNGRIEATEFDVAAKSALRVKEILVDEGDFVEAGQLLARMDTSQLEARRREAEAQLRRATVSVTLAKSLVAERGAEGAQARAMVAQRDALLDAAARRLERTEQLAKSNTLAAQILDDDRAAAANARAARAGADAQTAAAAAALTSAKIQVLDAEAAVEAARATIESITADIADGELRSPTSGRVQLRIAQPGEVLPPGGRVLEVLDLGNVYMTFFLPTEAAGRVALGSEVRLVLDANPSHVVPAKVTFVADVAQFTPKTVETEKERQKLVFRVKARISPELLRKYASQIKVGLPGTAHVRLGNGGDWPAALQKTVLE